MASLLLLPHPAHLLHEVLNLIEATRPPQSPQEAAAREIVSKCLTVRLAYALGGKPAPRPETPLKSVCTHSAMLDNYTDICFYCDKSMDELYEESISYLRHLIELANTIEKT